MPLLSFEFGGALFDIGGESFFGVLAGKQQLLEFSLDPQGFTESHFRAGNDCALDSPDGTRGLIGRAELLGIGHNVIPVRLAIIDIVIKPISRASSKLNVWPVAISSS